MAKRLLSCSSSELLNMSKDELLEAIKLSCGRTVLSENVASSATLCFNVTNSEIARAFGADLILLNCINLFDIQIQALPETDDPIRYLRNLVGRPVGVNIEPKDCNKEALLLANKYGFDFICLTANPNTNVRNTDILECIKLSKKYYKGIIIAGKMHSSGIDEDVINLETAKQFIESGIDILLVPAVGTVPGLSESDLTTIVKYAHKNKKLCMSTIGTSQESSSKEVIRYIALKNKIIGVDIQHIGDGSFANVGWYENIFELSKTIRGLTHTLRLIASSNLR